MLSLNRGRLPHVLAVLASLVAVTSVVTSVAGCGDNETPGTTALFAIPGGPPGDDFYAMPYPNDIYKLPDGTLDLSNFPTNDPIVDMYRVAAQELDGFGLNSAIYARFDGPLDPTTLPDPLASMQPGAAVYLVNVDTGSSRYGQQTPIVATFVADAGGTIGSNRLAVRPYPGFGLDEGTTYALVVTDRVHDSSGAKLVASNAFVQTRATAGGDDDVVAVRNAYAPLWAWLESTDGDSVEDVVSAAVFTTEHTSFVAPALRQAIFGVPVGSIPPPVAANVALTPEPLGTPWRLYTGTYVAPNFQSGLPPYLTSGGEISVGADGAAIIQRQEPMRFSIMIPAGTMPATGWPFAIYQHGTGGDYESYVGDGTGGRLAAQGIATISTDQVLHGPRNPDAVGSNAEEAEEVDFFNFGNAYAARDNALQGIADAFSQMRLAENLSFTDNGAPLQIDPNRMMFFGHSQGSETGPGFVAFEPSLKGAVLSGCAGVLYFALLDKTQPINIPEIVGAFLRDSPVDENNPSISLVQMWMERADVANFAPLMTRNPPTVNGVMNAPRNIFQSEGFVDTYAPNPGIEAFATALGGDLVKTTAEMDVEGLTQLRGRHVLPTPVMNNLNGATAVLSQYTEAPGSDGHFVVFEVPAAMAQSAQFLGTLAATGTATVVTYP